MSRDIAISLLFCASMIGCKTYDATLTYYDVNKPMQLGNFVSEVELDTLSTISAFLIVEQEEDTYSENSTTSISYTVGEYVSSTIDSAIVYKLNKHPSLFFGNTSIDLEIKHGVKLGAMIFGMIAGSITGSESEIGSYTIKTLTQNGTFYDINTKGQNDEN